MGVENFSFECIEECSIDELNIRERHYISLYKSNQPEYGYNLTSGGERDAGWRHSDATKQRLSALQRAKAQQPTYNNPAKGSKLIHKGDITSRAAGPKLDEMLKSGWELGPSSKFVEVGASKRTGENNGAYHKGYRFSGSNNHFYGKHHSEESKQKIREHMPDTSYNWRGHHHSEESKQKMRGPRPSMQGAGNPQYGKRGKSSTMYGRRAIHKDDIEKRVHASELDNYLANGWELGVKPSTLDTLRINGKRHMNKLISSGFDTDKFASTAGKRMVNKDGQRRYVTESELESYLLNGWKLGGKI